MTLSQLKTYLIAQKQAAITDMAGYFNVQPATLYPMLEKWINKGKVRKLPSGTACDSGCCKCDPATLEIYQWIDQPHPHYEIQRPA